MVTETIINLMALIRLKILVNLTTLKILKTLKKPNCEDTFCSFFPIVESVSLDEGVDISIIEKIIIKVSKYVNGSE